MVQVNVRIDDDLKEKADALFDELGLNMTTAVIMFLKASIREHGIPFNITTDIEERLLNKQLAEALIKNNPEPIKLEVDSNGNIIVDPELYPVLYDWVING